MNKCLFNLSICLLFLLPYIDSQAQENPDFDAIFEQWQDSNLQKPGVGIAVIKDNQVTYKKTFGYANLEYKIPLTSKSVFDIASVAKQFTGFAVAKLIIEKKLDLNTPAALHLPELKLLDPNIKVKHLLYHTSGLRDIGGLFSLAYLGDNLTSKDALGIIKNQKALNFPVGTRHDYSNTNYVLLAVIVERISGITFREYCATNIFSPLKMEDSFVNDNPYEIIDNRAVAYNSQAPNFSFLQNNGMALIGSSAVYSTIDDMIIWLQALQNETVFPEVFKLMKQQGELDNGEEINYGFGLSTGTFKNELMIEHTGATPSGFRTSMSIFPNQSLAMVILSNWGEIDPIGDVGIKIIENYLPKDTPNLEVSAEPKKEIILSEEIMERYTGNYLFNNEMGVKIRLNEEKKLTVQLEEQAINPLIAISETEFDFPALRSTLFFSLEADNTCQKVEVRMNGQKEGELTRVKKEKKISIDNSKYVGIFYSDELKIVFDIGLSNDRQLLLRNSKRGEIILKAKEENLFIPEQDIASSFFFERNEVGEVTSFFLNRGSRVRNMKFTKINP